ncbi:MAG: YHS domain-containing protein [FCB group bacterium]|nr:YHS domain-containing protein [FCB group bacterium]
MKQKAKQKLVTIDPVCGKRINRNKAHIAISYKGTDYLLCCPKCQSEFEKKPEKYVTD